MLSPRRHSIHAPLSPGEEVPRHPSAFPWPAHLARLLGQVTDRELGKRAGLCIRAVSDERRRRRLPPFQQQRGDVRWTKRMLARLGRAPDSVVAAKLGIGRSSVSYKRRVLGIAPFKPGTTPAFRWPSWALRKLGTVSDAALAKKLGVSATLVQTKRNTLRIPPAVPAARPVKWTPRMLKALDTQPDRAVARRFHITVMAVVRKRIEEGKRRGRSSRRWSPSEQAILGRLTDAAASRKLRVNYHAVRYVRRRLGIAGKQPSVRVSWTPQLDRLLGKLTDGQVAARAGCTAAGVARRRWKLGIDSPRAPRSWTRREDRLLGTAPDTVIARRLGRGEDGVRIRRRSLGIARFRRRS